MCSCQDLQPIFWDKHTSFIPFWNRQDKAYPPKTIWGQKIQINSLHFQSFKALNLIWSQKKGLKIAQKHFKSIIFFPDFSRLQGWGGLVRPNLENSRFFFLNPSLILGIFRPCFFLFLWKMTFPNPPTPLKYGKFHTYFWRLP